MPQVIAFFSLFTGSLVKKMKKTPSRVLNENGILLSLSAMDFVGIGLIYLISQQIFVPLRLELIPLLLMVITVVVVSGVRMKCRKKIIRDTLRYLYFKLLFSGFYNAP